MNYDVLHEGSDYRENNGSKPIKYNEDLLGVLEDTDVIDMEVDFSIVVTSLRALTTESSYDDKHRVLSNLGYLLSHNAPSLEGYDEKLNTDKDFADTLILLWQSGESDERVVDQYLKKAQKLLK